MTITGPASKRNEDVERNQPLTAREKQIMGCITLGMYNQEIADSLEVSIKTVENHVSNIMFKTGLGRRVLLALWWDHANPKSR